jgi:signal recognition particle subunit SRP54
MGDLLTLIEQAEQVFDAEQSAAAAAKISSGELSLEDFLQQMLQLRKMGPIGNILNMLPGMNSGQMPRPRSSRSTTVRSTSLQAIIRGMTPAEREDPKIINASRRQRIATGSGVSVSDVNDLVNRFFDARKMMKQMAGQFGFGGGGRSATKKVPKNPRKARQAKKGRRSGNPANRAAAGMRRTCRTCRRACSSCRPGATSTSCRPGSTRAKLNFGKKK